ncbi:NUDIX domain-containing protein [Amycolatopsis samaneae]|uniref:NUDIX domain-containing protein n=1 Tax=Amycolatopsis samaneae TaxID=664691 RepID=A0ABW5GLL5_9PSEU
MAPQAEKHLAYTWVPRGGTVLFLRRHPENFLGGKWELPGGTVEPGEPPERTAVRETAEEAGLTITVTGERSRHTWRDVTGRDLLVHAIVYQGTESGLAGDVTLSPGEHDEFAWLTPERAAALDLLPHIRETLAAARPGSARGGSPA